MEENQGKYGENQGCLFPKHSNGIFFLTDSIYMIAKGYSNQKLNHQKKT